MTDADKQLGALERAAKRLGICEVEVPDIPDTAGRVRAVEVKLGEMRRAWNDEAVAAANDPESPHGPETLGDQTPEPGEYGGIKHPKVTGKAYRTVTTSSTKRTYGTAAILNGIADTDELPEVTGPMQALMWAIEQGIAKLTWNWTPLQKAAKALGLPMRVVRHSIVNDGDVKGAWVGEDRTEKSTQEPIPR